MKLAYTIATPEARADRVFAWRAPLEESLPVLADLEYQGLELMVRSPEEFDAQAALAAAERYGLRFAAVSTGPIALERGLSLSAEDQEVRREAIRAAEAALRLCFRLGADMTLGAFRGRCRPEEVTFAQARLLHSLRALVPLAEELGVRVCVEPQNRFQSSLFRTVRETLPFLEELGSGQVGLSLDSFHMNIEESCLSTAFEAAAALLFHVQFADNHRGAPGTGMIPFDEYRKRLQTVGYDGWISMEIAQHPDPATAAATAAREYHRFMLEHET